MKAARTAMWAALAAACLALPPHVVACGSDFVLGDEVGAAHPASIGVAFAMLDARHAGTLAPIASERTESRVSADAAAHMLEERLASVRAGMPAVSMLLVESRLWTRYAPPGKRFTGVEDDHAGHDAGPVDGDVVLVTGEAVLRGLLAGNIAWQQAIDTGLVVLTGDPVRRARVTALLAVRFTPPGNNAVANRALPARL